MHARFVLTLVYRSLWSRLSDWEVTRELHQASCVSILYANYLIQITPECSFHVCNHRPNSHQCEERKIAPLRHLQKPIFLRHPKQLSRNQHHQSLATMAADSLPPHLRKLLHGFSLDEFCCFHRADRRVYSRLVVNLNRDLYQSVQVMALLMWLERAGRDQTLVTTVLKWPDSVLNALADEAVECLICMQRDEFPPSSRTSEMCFARNLTNREIGLGFFHKHRVVILQGMNKVINEVCVLAFFDIMQKIAQNKARTSNANAKSSNFANPSEQGYGDQSVYLIPPAPYQGMGVGPPNVPSSFIPLFKNGGFLDLLFSENYEQEAKIWDEDCFLVEPSDSAIQDNIEVPPDERTIFLTFSKGYPIPESEVRDYFTRLAPSQLFSFYGKAGQILLFFKLNRFRDYNLQFNIIFNLSTMLIIK